MVVTGQRWATVVKKDPEIRKTKKAKKGKRGVGRGSSSGGIVRLIQATKKQPKKGKGG